MTQSTTPTHSFIAVYSYSENPNSCLVLISKDPTNPAELYNINMSSASDITLYSYSKTYIPDTVLEKLYTKFESNACPYYSGHFTLSPEVITDFLLHTTRNNTIPVKIMPNA